MRLFIFALIVLFPISSFAAGESIMEWWEEDFWWEQEESEPVENMQPQQQEQKSIESIQEKMKKLQRMLEQKSIRQQQPEYRPKKK